ncbi:UDP-N-acetylglucosamine 3-dehydrogenase [uncultured archaeon]|nr:UDP-N-acetylglucosamine 3-dehydrogenase [uncultured archaeon]
MRILVVGLGSMGKRRIRNLQRFGYDDIIGFDVRDDRRREAYRNYNVKIISSLTNVLKEKPDVMIISTPPDQHLKYANIAIKNNIDFFMEVNLLSEHVKRIIKNLSKKQIRASPSCTMRFHPIVKELKKLIDKKEIGEILTIHHHTGQFLPNWHPWEDYRDFFVSKRKTGGAKETLPVELVWLTYLFSEIKSVFGNVKKVSKLDVDIDDLYQVILEFKNNIFCTMTIDVISIPSFRETKILGERGAILCDFNKGDIRINKGKKWHKIKLKMGRVAKGYGGTTPPETLYEEEIHTFLNSLKIKKQYPYSLNDELKMLKILDAIEFSSKKGKKIFVN